VEVKGLRITRKDVDVQLEILNERTKKKYGVGRNTPDTWTRNDLYTGELKQIGDSNNYYLSHGRTMGGYMLTTREMFFALRVVNDILRNETQS
jgi:hypothetical protein